VDACVFLCVTKCTLIIDSYPARQSNIYDPEDLENKLTEMGFSHKWLSINARDTDGINVVSL